MPPRAFRRAAERLAADMWHTARRPELAFDGDGLPPPACRRTAPALTEPGALVVLLLTFDHGHHASGWWKNADYDRCFHLSLSLHHMHASARTVNTVPEPLPRRELDVWATTFFREHTPKLWLEPGYRVRAVTHLRLFVDPHGAPILPRGEVYHLRPYLDGSSPEKVFAHEGGSPPLPRRP